MKHICNMVVSAKQNLTKQWLQVNNFHYNRIFSNEDDEVYTYRFPVYRYEKFTVLECEFKVILGEKHVIIDVYDYNTLNKYAPFYYLEYGDYDKMLDIIWDKIEKELKKIGVMIEEGEHGGDKSKNQKNKRQGNNTHKSK